MIQSKTCIRIAVTVAAVLLAGLGMWYLSHYNLGSYHYESSDRRFADLEVQWKGRDFDVVQANFQEYKASVDNPDVTLCRTFTRDWSDPRRWWDNVFGRRWLLPYIPPSADPNYHNWSDQGANLQSASRHGD